MNNGNRILFVQRHNLEITSFILEHMVPCGLGTSCNVKSHYSSAISRNSTLEPALCCCLETIMASHDKFKVERFTHKATAQQEADGGINLHFTDNTQYRFLAIQFKSKSKSKSNTNHDLTRIFIMGKVHAKADSFGKWEMNGKVNNMASSKIRREQCGEFQPK